MTPNPDDREPLTIETLGRLLGPYNTDAPSELARDTSARMPVTADYWHVNGPLTEYVSKTRARANAFGAKVPGKFKRRK